MIKVHFTSALKRFFPNLQTIEVEASDVSTALLQVEEKYPGMKSYLMDETEQLRPHVNIFIGEDIATLENEVSANDEIFIFQALSGG
ncbi:MoaD/ThiS family protein [Portibacter lacus]|uniref:MoaD/ThiS family protein n=1 Tax=Portibacter lacus TaxID=1099794 RepID=A0AA37WFT8_9BACT|nr:MoaD/ThiS family protein [Portibacter lacus]GLR18029.1 hypothetical protein GCM10007940_26440 [Portibacter lacus]